MTEKDNAVEEGTIATDLVVTKYKLAGEIANRMLILGFNFVFYVYYNSLNISFLRGFSMSGSLIGLITH